jgi:rRNA-processing protein FCF1
MRHGRAKAARKTLAYFGRTVGLKAPYNILLDATLVVAMFNQKILPFKERMDRVLQTTGSNGPNVYCIAKGAVDELEMVFNNIKAKNHSKATSFEQALEFIRNECIVLNRRDSEKIKEHEKFSEEEEKLASVKDDLLSYIQNDNRPYVVASQDEALLSELRSMGTVPIIRLANTSVLILENPSKQSQLQFQGKERKKWKHSLQESERELVNFVKSQKKQAVKQTAKAVLAPHQRAKSKARGPNPLSCKRKQASYSKTSGKETSSKKRRLRAKREKSEA